MHVPLESEIKKIKLAVCYNDTSAQYTTLSSGDINQSSNYQSI